MRVRRTVKEKDVVKILVFGCDRKFIKSSMDSGFRSMSAVFTGQLIQLAKAYGEKKVIKYQKEEEEVCQDTIETR